MNDAIHIEDDGDDGPTAPFWMATFSDMVTLLLTFFVLIVSMSEVEVKKFKEALSYFQGSSGVLVENSVMPSPQTQTMQEQAEAQAMAYEELLQFLENNDVADQLQVNLTERGVHVVINDSVMFRTGEAELLGTAQRALSLVAGMQGPRVQSVVVEGHTDDVPINTAQFPSNWELSVARAASVVRFLLSLPDALPPDRYNPAGYGEFRPLDTNDTAAGRARNRRVEILFSWNRWQNQISPAMPVATP